MITLNKFIQNNKKSRDMHLCSPDVPNFYKGFYAIYKPNSRYNKSRYHLKRWHVKNKGKIIETAEMIISIEKAHIFWNENLMINIKAKLN